MRKDFINNLSDLTYGKDFSYALNKNEDIFIEVDHNGSYDEPYFDIKLIIKGEAILLIGDVTKDDVSDKETCEAIYNMARQQIVIEMRRAYRKFNSEHTTIMDVIKEMSK